MVVDAVVFVVSFTEFFHHRTLRFTDVYSCVQTCSACLIVACLCALVCINTNMLVWGIVLMRMQYILVVPVQRMFNKLGFKRH